jgi:hypothetical protein
MRELGLVMDTRRGLNNVNRAFHFIDRPRKRMKTSETGYRKARRSVSVRLGRAASECSTGAWIIVVGVPRIDNVCFSKLTKSVCERQERRMKYDESAEFPGCSGSCDLRIPLPTRVENESGLVFED